MAHALGFFLFGTVLVAVFAALLLFLEDKSRTGKIDLLNPGLVFLVLQFLYNGLVFVTREGRSGAGAPDFAFVVFMGTLGIFSGTFLAHGWRSRPGRRLSPAVGEKNLLFYGLSLMMLCIAMTFVMLSRNIGFSRILTADSFERNAAMKGALTGFTLLLPIGAGFAIALLARRRGIFRKWHVLPLLAVMGGMFYFTSSRGQILQACLLAVFVFHYRYRRIPNRVLISIGLALLLAMVSLGLVRAGINRDWRGIVEIFSVKRVAERFLPENLEPYHNGVRSMELVKDGPPDGEYLWGSSFLYFIPSLAPRFLNLWERPTTLEAWYVEKYDPTTALMGGGWGFSPLVDAYFNFGPAGCFLYFLFFSFALNRLHLRAVRMPSASRLRLIDCLVAATLIEVGRASISAYVRNYLCIFLLAGWLLVTFSLRSRGGQATHGSLNERR